MKTKCQEKKKENKADIKKKEKTKILVCGKCGTLSNKEKRLCKPHKNEKLGR